MPDDGLVTIDVTVSFSYKASPEMYGTSDPKEMAEIDYSNFDDDFHNLLYAIEESSNFTLTVTPRENSTSL